MNAALRRGALLVLVVLAGACSDSDPPPIAPTSTAGSMSTPAPGAGGTPPGFPAVTRPARVYAAADSPASSYHGSPLASRYVLYDDGTFALQYSSANYPFFEYRGTFKEANGVITFEWEGWSVAGPWGATGTINVESLVVRYNEIMRLSDFEDGVYLRTQ